MTPSDSFREACRRVFTEVASRYSWIVSWRMCGQTPEEGGPTFEVKTNDGGAFEHTVPDFHQVTGYSDASLRDEFNAFLRGVEDDESTESEAT